MAATTLARSIRAPEVTLMLGFPAAAGLYGLDDLSVPNLLLLIAVITILAPVAVSIYAYNALAGQVGDSRDPKFADNPLLTGDLPSSQLRLVVWIGFASGVLASAALSWRMTVSIVILWLLWMAYSHPKGLKGIAGGGTALHVVGGALLFLIPYSMMHSLDSRGLWLATVFSLAFASGHCNHEILDHATDQAAGLRTFTVRFSPERTRALGLVLVVFAYSTVALGWLRGPLKPAESLPLLAALPFHLCGSFFFDHRTEIPQAARCYRSWYRVVFAFATAASLTGHLLIDN